MSAFNARRTGHLARRAFSSFAFDRRFRPAQHREVCKQLLPNEAVLTETHEELFRVLLASLDRLVDASEGLIQIGQHENRCKLY